VPPLTLPFHLHQSTYRLLSTMTDCNTNTATAPLSACHEAQVKTLPIQSNLSWSPLPLVPLSLHCCIFFFLPRVKLLYLAPILPFLSEPSVVHHLPLCGPETHSLQACLSLCRSSNRVLSLSITLDIHIFFLILRPLSANLRLLFARLPHGNLGKPNTKNTLCSLRI